jgi:hypothetical protein
MLTTLSIIIWPIGIIFYIIWNLFSKNVRLEEMLNKQETFVRSILNLADNIDKTAMKIDSTLWVSSDPELKMMFDDIKAMQEHIKSFTNKI